MHVHVHVPIHACNCCHANQDGVCVYRSRYLYTIYHMLDFTMAGHTQAMAPN